MFTSSFVASNQFAEVEVRDTGIGIDADFLPWVLKDSVRPESSVTRSHRGMGLGFGDRPPPDRTARGNGHCSTATVKDHGATFTIRVPLAADRGAADDNRDAETSQESSQTLTGLRVLLVEDEPDARELLALTLRVSGASVYAVESVREALRHLNVVQTGCSAQRHRAAGRKRLRSNSPGAGAANQSPQDSGRRVDGLCHRKRPPVGVSRRLSGSSQPNPSRRETLIEAIEKLVNGKAPTNA